MLAKEKGQKLIAINWHGSALKSMRKYQLQTSTNAFLANNSKQRKLISLQKGTGKKELDNCSFKQHFHEQQDKINKEERIEHIAGIITNCDAVICDDSGPAHLASNLGAKTIINARSHCSLIWQQNRQLSRRFYPLSETNYFTNNWLETISLGWGKLNNC